MLAARADLTIEGPGVAVHVHGDGPVLIADVRGGFRSAARAVRAIRGVPGLIRLTRTTSRALRASGLRVEVRLGGRTFARLG